MAITKEDILNTVAEMSVMDICELVKMMENKFNISSSISNSFTLSDNNKSINNSAEVIEEKNEFNVILVNYGSNKIAAIKVVRSVTGLGLKEAKNAVENTPFILKEAISKDKAQAIKKQFEDVGAVVDLK